MYVVQNQWLGKAGDGVKCFSLTNGRKGFLPIMEAQHGKEILEVFFGEVLKW